MTRYFRPAILMLFSCLLPVGIGRAAAEDAKPPQADTPQQDVRRKVDPLRLV
jgi:hypothetical protein